MNELNDLREGKRHLEMQLEEQKTRSRNWLKLRLMIMMN